MVANLALLACRMTPTRRFRTFPRSPRAGEFDPKRPMHGPIGYFRAQGAGYFEDS
jgi:hypothetical protein